MVGTEFDKPSSYAKIPHKQQGGAWVHLKCIGVITGLDVLKSVHEERIRIPIVTPFKTPLLSLHSTFHP